MTVEEVKKLIKEKQALGEQLTFLEEEKKEQTESAESLRAEIEELREKLKQAEDKPIEVVKRDLDEEEIDKIRLSIRQELHAEHMKELNALKKSSREAVKAAEAEKDNALKEAQTERDNAVNIGYFLNVLVRHDVLLAVLFKKLFGTDKQNVSRLLVLAEDDNIDRYAGIQKQIFRQ